MHIGIRRILNYSMSCYGGADIIQIVFPLSVKFELAGVMILYYWVYLCVSNVGIDMIEWASKQKLGFIFSFISVAYSWIVVGPHVNLMYKNG